MKNVAMYELSEKMPSYLLSLDTLELDISNVYSENGFNAQSSDDFDDSLADWVSQKHKTGKLGEKIAKSYLTKNFFTTVHLK